jgi:hypothetical protein
LGSRQIGESEFVERKDTAEFVFFYQTLLPPFVPEAIRDVVARLHFHGDGSLCGVLYDLGEYPGAAFGATTGMRVDGTVFELPEDPQVLEALECYEGYEPTLMLRTCSFASSSASTSRLATRLNAGPTNTMGTRTARWSMLADAMNAQVNAHKQGRTRNYEFDLR